MRSHTTSKRDATHADFCRAICQRYGGHIRDYYNIGWPGHPDCLHATGRGLTLIGWFDPAQAVARLAGLEGLEVVLPGANVYCEWKSPGGKLEDDQEQWIREHEGPVLVASTLEEVLAYGKRE